MKQLHMFKRFMHAVAVGSRKAAVGTLMLFSLQAPLVSSCGQGTEPISKPSCTEGECTSVLISEETCIPYKSFTTNGRTFEQLDVPNTVNVKLNMFTAASSASVVFFVGKDTANSEDLSVGVSCSADESCMSDIGSRTLSTKGDANFMAVDTGITMDAPSDFSSSRFTVRAGVYFSFNGFDPAAPDTAAVGSGICFFMGKR